MEALQVDDVRHDVGAACRGGRRRPCRKPDGTTSRLARRIVPRTSSRRARQELGGLAAAVVDDHGHPPQTRDPDRRRREQVPGPARVGHHVHDVAAPRGAPQRERDRARAGTAPARRASVRPSAGRYGALVATSEHLGPLAAQQLGELPRLHRHAAGRRRQRADEPDAQSLPGPSCRFGALDERLERLAVVRHAGAPSCARSRRTAARRARSAGQRSRCASSRSTASASASALPAGTARRSRRRGSVPCGRRRRWPPAAGPAPSPPAA